MQLGSTALIVTSRKVCFESIEASQGTYTQTAPMLVCRGSQL